MISKKKRLRYKRAAIEIAKEHALKLDENDWEQIWSLLNEYGETTYLYAIVDQLHKLVKFGKSVSPGMRVHQLKTANPGDLKIWGYCPEKSPLTEREVHELLKHQRVTGEWFTLNTETQGVIDRMRQCAGVNLGAT